MLIFKVEVKRWDWKKIEKIEKTRLRKQDWENKIEKTRLIRLRKQDRKDWKNKIDKIEKTRLKRLRKQDRKD